MSGRPYGRTPRVAPSPFVAALAAALFAAACRDAPAPPGAGPAAASGVPNGGTSAAAPRAPRPAVVREGGALARAVDEDALYVADEDLGVVRKVPLAFDEHTQPITVSMPGAPAAVLPLDGRVLVTVRAFSGDPGEPPRAPGLLLVMRPDAKAGLVEAQRVELPADAWGLAVTPDEKTALVTSAWTHKVSAIDLEQGKVRWSIDVGREPRGVVVRPDGAGAYVTHLVRAALTRIDGIASAAPTARVVPFPAAPVRTAPDRADAATLGYAPVISPDGARLFVGRQALGATGKRAWNGQPTVDVLLLADESPLAVAPKRWFKMISAAFLKNLFLTTDDATLTGPGPTLGTVPFAQPRAAVYRKATRTLLLASEGTDMLLELDALAIDPAIKPLRFYDVGGARRFEPVFFPGPGEREKDPPPGETHCGAPSGVALSEDESTAYVYCRTSHDLVAVALDPLVSGVAPPRRPPDRRMSFGSDPLPEPAALGRRLFFNAIDQRISGSYACNGCHPEGRDDGHVWHEEEAEEEQITGKKAWTGTNLHAFEMNMFFMAGKVGSTVKGAPRQTPMLAGRLKPAGPYGWKGRSPNLRHRVISGFVIHRWAEDGFWEFGPPAIERAEAIAAFARQGLVPPPREERPPTPEEERGRTLFHDPNVGCVECHAPAGGEYTNRGVVGLGTWPVKKTHFDEEQEHWKFKTPSLRYVGGTPPYYHDGSEPTLDSLIEHNGTRMGHTQQLSAEDRKALVAFLKTL